MSEGKSRDDEQADGPKGAWRRLIDRLPRGAAKRADLLRRDLGMVVRTLKGHHPSPVVRDHHLHRADVASKAVTSGANRPLRVEEVIVI